MSHIGSTEWYQKVQAGLVAGHAIVHKFGFASIGTTLQPITLSGEYRMPTAAEALELVSSDATDTSAGAAAQKVSVLGLNSAWAEVEQEVTMNGTTAVALGTDLIRAYRMFVTEVGTYRGSNAGTITLREAPGGQAWAQIGTSPTAHGQTLVGCYTVPTAKTGYILGVNVGVDSNKNVDFLLQQIPGADDVATSFVGAARTLLYEVGITGQFTLQTISPLGGIAGPADIRAMAIVGTGSADVSVDFELLLVDD